MSIQVEGLQETEELIWPVGEVAQAVLDMPWENGILTAMRERLRLQNRCAVHDERDPNSLVALNAHYKVARVMNRVTTSIGRVLAGPHLAAEACKSELSGGLREPYSDSDPPPLICYQVRDRMNPHPPPLARFLVEHADIMGVALARCEEAICTPGNLYASFAQQAAAIKEEDARTQNAKRLKEREEARPPVGKRQSIEPLPQRPLIRDRDSLVENAYLMLQALFAADLACAERGIYDKDKVLRVVLANAELFKRLIKTTSDELPYCTPLQDGVVYNSPYAGTFYRMVEVCTGEMAEGAMRLQEDGRLVSHVDDAPLGGCPLGDTEVIFPGSDAVTQMDNYYKIVSEKRGIPLHELRDDKDRGSFLNLFFVYSAILGRDLFYGTSHKLAEEARRTAKYKMRAAALEPREGEDLNAPTLIWTD